MIQDLFIYLYKQLRLASLLDFSDLFISTLQWCEWAHNVRLTNEVFEPLLRHDFMHDPGLHKCKQAMLEVAFIANGTPICTMQHSSVVPAKTLQRHPLSERSSGWKSCTLHKKGICSDWHVDLIN